VVRTLDYAVLGLVARAPSTGYEVAARMKRPVGYYWVESHGGIYPSLRWNWVWRSDDFKTLTTKVPGNYFGVDFTY